MKKIVLILVISLFLGTGNNVFALTYSESSNGELGYVWPSGYPGIGLLDLGDNTVSGTMGSSDTDDSFYFTLSDGMKLTGISMYFLTDYNDDNGDSLKMANIAWNLIEDGEDYPVYYTGTIDMLGSSPFVFNNLPDLNPGDYRMANDIMFYTGDSWTTSYTLNFQVDSTAAPIPEPATMMLFGIGLLGLAGVSRRKK